jgi:tetratricopeptide (TPR) repeat protein
MDLAGRIAALYGRFTPGARETLQARVRAAGGGVTRDLTRRSDILVIGARAFALIDSGALSARIATARARAVPVFGERSFEKLMSGKAGGGEATLPLAAILSETMLTPDEAGVLAAFDIIALDNGYCRFEDARALRAAAELRAHGRSLGETTHILARARDLAPKGRHRVQLGPSGEAVLEWDDGLTTLEGQGLLPLGEEAESLDDLFEAAALAEARGDANEAARLYDLVARTDRADPIAPYNLGNMHLAQGASEGAELAYRRALARDPDFVEARYNLAQALEAMGKVPAAQAELEAVVDADPTFGDALFNLAQLRMKFGALDAARALWERYLALGPPPDGAAVARKAILYCTYQDPALVAESAAHRP